MTERTLAIIKPDAVAAGHSGPIIEAIEEDGLAIVAMKRVRLTPDQARAFYYVHSERPFFGSLTEFMSEGPVVVMVLEGEDAIGRWRRLMGATNPEEAEEGTVRDRFGTNIERNAVHGSDAPETADFEIRYFFNALEVAE